MADVQPENGTTQNELIGDGYIILARRVFNNDHWVWQLPPNHFKFLIGIIFAARWGKNPADFTAPDGTVLKIKRGQYACAERRLAEKFKLSRQVIRTCLKKLSSYGFLTHKVAHGITVITVLNYDTYQNPALYYNPENNPSLTQGQPKPNPLKNKENKDNKVNQKEYSGEIEKTIAILAKIPSVTPDMLKQTPDRLDEYIAEWPDIDPVLIAKSMLAWYSDPKNTVKNVSGALRNWFKNDYEKYEKCFRNKWEPVEVIE